VSVPYLDADVIVRLLTGDDPTKQRAARSLFVKVERGEVVLATPQTTIADVVFVLTSKRTYDLPRDRVSMLLISLLRFPGFRVPDKPTVVRALELFGATNLDFGDVMILATMEAVGSGTVISYDRGFDPIPSVVRVEP
jgi:predicted nucleic acid-binding protein